MRVALHFPDDHPVSPGAVVAYKLGRIEDGVHNHDLITGETTSVDELKQKLYDLAKKEHPDADVVFERLVLDYDGEIGPPPDGLTAVSGEMPDQIPLEGKWIPEDDFDPEVHTPAPSGNQIQAPALQAQMTVSAG